MQQTKRMPRGKPLSTVSAAKATSKLAEDLNAFENRHHVFLNAANSNAEQLTPSDVRRGMAIQAQVSPQEHIKVLASLIPKQDISEQDSKLYLEKIRAKRVEQQLSKKEREIRRRKVLLEEQRKTERVNSAKENNALLQKVYRQSQEERRVAEQLHKVMLQKQLMTANRAFREAQYQAQRQRDYEEAMEREYEVCERQRAEYNKTAALHLQQHRALIQEREERRRQKHTAACKDMVVQLVNLSIKLAEHKHLNDGNILPWFQREVKSLYIRGHALDRSYDVGVLNDRLDFAEITPTAVGTCLDDKKEKVGVSAEVLETVQQLDEESFRDYLYGQGNWLFPPTVTLPNPVNEPLSKVVAKILDAVHTPEVVQPTVQLPALPLKVALIGKKFSGKSTVATKLVKHYGLRLVSVDDLVRAAAEAPVTAELDAAVTDKDAALASRVKRQQLVTSVQECLTRGEPLSDQLLVQLVVDTLQQEQQQPPSKSDRATPGLGGWALVDFPRTRVQAQLLERELTGYEEPKVIKPGNFKRVPQIKDSKQGPSGSSNQLPGPASQQQLPVNQKKKSQIAPETGSNGSVDAPQTLTAKSGFDAVILLDVMNENLFKRFAGRRDDPLTGAQYHLELNPPPLGNPGLNERLVAGDDPSGAATQLQFLVSAFEDNEEPLKDWYQRFKVMKCVDANASPEQTLEAVQRVIKELMVAKQAEKDEKDRERRKLEEKVAETKEPSEPAAAAVSSSNAKLFASVKAELLAKTDEHPDTTIKAPDKKPRTASPNKSRVSSAAKERKSQANLSAKKETSSRTSSAKTPEKEKNADAAAAGNSLSPPALQASMQSQPLSAGAPGSPSPTSAAAAAAAAAVAAAAEAVAAIKENASLVRKQPKAPSRELLGLLADQWAVIESNYTNSIKYIFRCLRREREEIIVYFYETKAHFREFLARPDRKQWLLTQFQRSYNDLEEDMRTDPDVKAELHQRTDDLRDALWEIADKRKDDAEAERVTIIEDHFAEDHFTIVINLCIGMMQCEIDRYAGTRQLLLDYARECMGMAVDEQTTSINAAPKLIYSVPTPENPLQFTNSLITTKREPPVTNKKTSNPGGTAAPAAKRAPGGAAAGAGSTSTAANAANAGAAGAARAEDTSDQMIFAPLNTALDAALAFLAHQEDLERKDSMQKDRSADKKKSGTADALASDTDVEPPVDCIAGLKADEQITRARLERIKMMGMAFCKIIRDRATEGYTQLDDWIGRRYKGEMDAIREMTFVVKEAIELESTLPNELVLQGDMFRINYDTLTCLPQHPTLLDDADDQPDQFSLGQVTALLPQLRQCAPGGFLTVRGFIDLMQRIAMSTTAYEAIPEALFTGDYRHLQHMAVALDASKTGSVSWRKFLLLSLGILPIPSSHELLDFKRSLLSLPSYEQGLVRFSDALTLPMWFEGFSHLGSSPAARMRKASKIKVVLYELFAVGRKPPVPAQIEASSEEVAQAGATVEWHGELVASRGILPAADNAAPSLSSDRSEEWVSVGDLLLHCSMDENGREGLRKAFVAKAVTDDGAVSLDDLYEVTAQGNRFAENGAHDAFSRDMLALLFAELGISLDGSITFSTFASILDRISSSSSFAGALASDAPALESRAAAQPLSPLSASLAFNLFTIEEIPFVFSRRK